MIEFMYFQSKSPYIQIELIINQQMPINKVNEVKQPNCLSLYKIQLIPLSLYKKLKIQIQTLPPMNPNSSLMKKRDDFKKQIRKDQLEKKRVDIRRGLPYYESMFSRGEDESNGTQSRSSRFPVPVRNGMGENGNGQVENYQQEQQIDKELAEKQSQMRYVQYLRALSTTTQHARGQKVSLQFTTHYGSDCFTSLDHLIQQLSVTLMQHQNDLMDSTDAQSLSRLDWEFIEAALYFSEDQNLSILHETCVNLITKYMIPWCEARIQAQIGEGLLEVDQFLDLLADTHEQIRTIEDILLAHFISLTSSQNELNQQNINLTINYFTQKLDMFQSLQRHLYTHYPHHSQTPYFSQLFYDYPSLYFMQTLSSTISHKQTSTETKLSAYILLNKYFTGYPLQVESETQSNEKLKNFLQGYVKQLTTFFRLCKLGNTEYVDGGKYLEMIKTTVGLLGAIIMKDFNDEGVLVDIIMAFGVVVDTVVKLKIPTNILECLDIHVGLLDCFTLLTSFVQNMNNLFGQTTFLDYLNALLIVWDIFKCQNRLQGNFLETSHSNTMQFTKLQFFLIHCLYITKKNIRYTHLTHANQKFVQNMFDHADMIYNKEKSMIDELKKRGENQTRAKEMFLFEENVKLYFKMLKGKEDVSNPETTEQYNHQQDVEI